MFYVTERNIDDSFEYQQQMLWLINKKHVVYILLSKGWEIISVL